MGGNERRRAVARERGESTFVMEITAEWPACVECGCAIRRSIDVGRPGLWRDCGCIGVAWSCGANGWQRHALGAPRPAAVELATAVPTGQAFLDAYCTPELISDPD